MVLALLVAQATAQSTGIDDRWFLGAIGVLIGVIGWFVKRELGRVERVEDDVRRLLAGDVPWVKSMGLEITNLRDTINRLYRPRNDD